jgi:hypothetical protein
MLGHWGQSAPLKRIQCLTLWKRKHGVASAVDNPELDPTFIRPSETTEPDGPEDELVTAVPQLGPDLETILSFLETESPIMVTAQPTTVRICLAHGFGDT